MADGIFTEAAQSGQHIRVTANVDEGAGGIVAYTAQVAIADLKLLNTVVERRNALIAAISAVRDRELAQDVIDRQLANLIGVTFTL